MDKGGILCRIGPNAFLLFAVYSLLGWIQKVHVVPFKPKSLSTAVFKRAVLSNLWSRCTVNYQAIGAFFRQYHCSLSRFAIPHQHLGILHRLCDGKAFPCQMVGLLPPAVEYTRTCLPWQFAHLWCNGRRCHAGGSPFVMNILERIPSFLIPFLAAGLAVYFIGDTIVNVHTILDFNKKNGRIVVLDEIRERAMCFWRKRSRIWNLPLKAGCQPTENRTRSIWKKLRQKQAALEQNSKLHRRLMNAFPTMKSLRAKRVFGAYALRYKNGVKKWRPKR